MEAESSLGGLKDGRMVGRLDRQKQSRAGPSKMAIMQGTSLDKCPSHRKKTKPPTGPDLSALVATLPGSSSQGRVPLAFSALSLSA